MSENYLYYNINYNQLIIKSRQRSLHQIQQNQQHRNSNLTVKELISIKLDLDVDEFQPNNTSRTPETSQKTNPSEMSQKKSPPVKLKFSDYYW